MREKPTNEPIIHSVAPTDFGITLPVHNILSTAPQLSISQKALGTLPEDGNVIWKYGRATIHN
jgi:hypothetical protein